MSENVVAFNGNTRIDQPPPEILEKAKDWGMSRCLIVGIDDDGEFHFGGSFSDAGEMVLLLEEAKRRVLATVFP